MSYVALCASFRPCFIPSNAIRLVCVCASPSTHTHTHARAHTHMIQATDPTYNTLIPYLNQSSAIKAGVVWAGNGAVTDTIDIFSNVSRFATPSMPLAMYRGSKDSTMTPWAQQEVQRKFNASGSRCDLFAVPGVGHSSLFPNGNVTTKNGVPVAKPAPVLDHSYGWITEAMGLIVKP